MTWCSRFAGLIVVTGCISHVAIPPLPPDLTPAQRVGAYARYRPRARELDVVTQCTMRGCTSNSSASAILADGTRVFAPEDLLPLVSPASATARFAHRAATARSVKRWMLAAMIATFTTGVYLIASSGNPPAGTEKNVGIGLLGGAVASLFGTVIAAGVDSSAIDDALDTYPADLGERLHVCVNGLAFVPCEANVPGASSPIDERPDPALGKLRQLP